MRISLLRPGHLVITVRSGEAPGHVPCHVDFLIGAARPANRLDGGPIDRVLRRYGGGSRFVCEYHARQSLGRVGAQHVGFDDFEERIGMSRSYKVEIGDPERSRDAVHALRELATIESARVEHLACSLEAPQPAVRPQRVVSKAQTREPHERIRAPQALALEEGDERVTTAVIDTGVTVGHPEFQRKCLAGYDTVDLGLGRVNDDLMLYGDSRGHDYNPRDEVGHGCHVAGIIGAQGWRIPRGIGGRTLLLAIRVLAAATPAEGGKRMGIGALGDINAGLKVAVDLGAEVVNMSLGTPESSADPNAGVPHARAIRYATQYGCVLIAAAGNSGKEEKYYPAAHPDVIAVGSVDTEGRRSRFSTFGEHIALAAPGENIVSAGRRGYQINSGTSFAAPFVAGVAALLVARARKHGKKLDTAAVRRIVTASARTLGGGPNRETGHGLLDALAAIQFLDRELGRSQ